MKFGEGLILCIAAGAALTAFFLTLVSVPLLGILQQEGYSGTALLSHTYKKGNITRRRLSLLAFTLALLTALFNVCFCFLPMPYPNLIAALPYFGLFSLYLVSERKYALKVPLKPTHRAIRLAAACFVLTALVSAGMEFGLAALSLWAGMGWLNLVRFVPIAVLPVLLPVLVSAANGVMLAFEIPHARKFIRRAKRTLDGSSCVKVGITGSFGKTSVKHYAAHLMEGSFRVKATPASYNTPIGIAKFINGEGCDCDIFLAEMGARRRGDIAELCDLVNPTVGVVTGVGSQHLQTFGSLDAIRTEKLTLACRTSLSILGSTCLSDAAPGSASCDAHRTLLEGRDFAAEDIRLSSEGTDFTLRLKERKVPVHTKLLGRHAAEDLAIAAALALELGVSFEEIAERMESVEPVPHRLQLIRANGVNILDDAYNANRDGARNAVETLKLFEGTKIVVTPGLVELGEMEEEANEELGRLLVGLDVILVGETRVLPVRNGYLSGGGDPTRLTLVPTLSRARSLLATLLHPSESDPTRRDDPSDRGEPPRHSERSEESRTVHGDATPSSSVEHSRNIASSPATVLFLNDLPDKY